MNVLQWIALDCKHSLLIGHSFADHRRRKACDLAVIGQRSIRVRGGLDHASAFTNWPPIVRVDAAHPALPMRSRKVKSDYGAARPVQQPGRQAVVLREREPLPLVC